MKPREVRPGFFRRLPAWIRLILWWPVGAVIGTFAMTMAQSWELGEVFDEVSCMAASVLMGRDLSATPTVAAVGGAVLGVWLISCVFVVSFLVVHWREAPPVGETRGGRVDGIWFGFSGWQATFARIDALDLTVPFTTDEVRSAYRRKVRTAHPDAGGTDKEFQALVAAYRKALTLASPSNPAHAATPREATRKGPRGAFVPDSPHLIRWIEDDE